MTELEVMRTVPRGHRDFSRALAALAGVKLRKAMIFLGHHPGTLARRARAQLDRAIHAHEQDVATRCSSASCQLSA